MMIQTKEDFKKMLENRITKDNYNKYPYGMGIIQGMLEVEKNDEHLRTNLNNFFEEFNKLKIGVDNK